MIKDILTDVVSHTHSLGFLPLVKITGDTASTIVEAMAEDRSVILSAKIKSPVAEFTGVFGMPNLDKLNLHLKNPEYRENAKIEVIKDMRQGQETPTNLHFENATGDFSNEYRFMNSTIINERLKSVKFKGATWNIEFEPAVSAINRLKLQNAVHSEEIVFSVKTKNSNLVFSFGDESTHAGEFVFESNVSGKLKQTWAWPVTQVQSILNLSGNKILRISDQGAMQITVDSGIAEYNYTLPAMSK